MAKPRNPQCETCSTLSATQAKAFSCWDGKRCHDRRSYYRKPQVSSGGSAETITITPPDTCFAVLYLYKEHGDKPLHALGAELWQGQKPLCRIEPIHTFGLTPGKIRTYANEVLSAFSSRVGVQLSQYKEQFEVNPLHCPTRPCPLHPEK